MGANAEQDLYSVGFFKNWKDMISFQSHAEDFEAHERKSTVATHAVACDAELRWIQDLKCREESLRQLRGNVTVHLVSPTPGLLGGIHKETRSTPKVVGLIFTLNIQAAFQIWQSASQRHFDPEVEDLRGLVSG
jgi:hypothetical protein